MTGHAHAYAVRTGDAWLIQTAPGTGVTSPFAAATLPSAKAAAISRLSMVHGPLHGYRWETREPGLSVLLYPSRLGVGSTERTVWEMRAPLTLELDRSVTARRLWAALETQVRQGLGNGLANERLTAVYAATHQRRRTAA